jgi:hypothetical protein
MGILLAFMFLVNMLGALILLPALSFFLLPKQGVSVAAPDTSPVASHFGKQSPATNTHG